MAQKQTRRSISVKGPTEFRILQYAAFRSLSRSGVIEEIILEKLGPVEATPDAPQARAATQPRVPQARVPKAAPREAPQPRAAQPRAREAAPREVPQPESPKTGLDPFESVMAKRPTNQPKPLKAAEKVEEESGEMAGYIKPHLMF